MEIPDDLSIPEFLKREPSTVRPVVRVTRTREKKIPYPRDGFLAKGMSEKERERLRASRRRHAEKVRKR